MYNDGKAWPDMQFLPHGLPGRAVKMQIQVTWRPEDDVSPFLTHVNQWMPGVYTLALM